jgi:uncharacterized protein (DUF1330 family)
MLERLLPAPLSAVAERRMPAPVVIPNLLTFADRAWYRRYGAAVYPALRAVGAQAKWFGERVATYHGERQCDELGFVQYPSHRRFLAMIGNPYYALINRLRERGVAGFEAAFAEPSDPEASLWRHENLLAIHFTPAGTTPPAERGRGESPDVVEDEFAAVSDAFAGTDAEPVYAVRECSPWDFFGEPTGPAAPRPLSHPGIACFAVEDRETAERAATAASDTLEASTAGYACCLYRRTEP